MSADLRTLEDFLRHRLTTDRKPELTIRKDGQGRFQANLKNPDGSWTVDVSEDPADALWNVLAPHTLRRRAPSGREMAGEQHGFMDYARQRLVAVAEGIGLDESALDDLFGAPVADDGDLF